MVNEEGNSSNLLVMEKESGIFLVSFSRFDKKKGWNQWRQCFSDGEEGLAKTAVSFLRLK
jgi:hypothetical protein